MTSINGSKDQHISTERTTTSGNGVYGLIEIDHINYRPSLGLGLDLNLGRFLVGGGVNSWNYTEQVKQDQMKNGIVIKPHSHSESQSNLSYDVHAGLGIGPKNGSKLYLIGGQDSEMGNYTKAQLNIRLNKPRNNIGKRGK